MHIRTKTLSDTILSKTHIVEDNNNYGADNKQTNNSSVFGHCYKKSVIETLKKQLKDDIIKASGAG